MLAISACTKNKYTEQVYQRTNKQDALLNNRSELQIPDTEYKDCDFHVEKNWNYSKRKILVLVQVVICC